MKFIIEILLMGVAVMLAAYFIPNVQVDGFTTALIAGVLISLANATIGLILRILTFPINILTLGLMSFLISVLMVSLVDHYMTGFNIQGFITTVLFALVLSVLKMVFGIFKD